jgi:hypothetical protein
MRSSVVRRLLYIQRLHRRVKIRTLKEGFGGLASAIGIVSGGLKLSGKPNSSRGRGDAVLQAKFDPCRLTYGYRIK